MKKPLSNGIPTGMPNHLTGGLPNHYREANGYSAEVTYQYRRSEVDQDIYHKVDRQCLPTQPRFTEAPGLLESASAIRLSSGEKDQGEKITGKVNGRSKKSTKISTEMPTELPTEKQSTEMATKKSTGRSPRLCSALHHWEASTS